MSSTLERFCLIQRRVLERSVTSSEPTPRVLSTGVLPRRRLRHALGGLLDLVALLHRHQPDGEGCRVEAGPSPQVVLLAASVTAELAFLCHHPQLPASRHLDRFMEHLAGLPSALVPSTVREHVVECLWHLGGVAYGLSHGSVDTVRRQALRAAGHLVLVAEITGGLDDALSQLDPADDELTIPELGRHG